MSDSLFPSGPWTGFYNYRPGDRHKMELHLTFAAGRLSGDGTDDVGPFLIKGRYNGVTRECHWTKSYLGAHDVFYRGFREAKGIWGTWEITILEHGGFHIWPRQAAEDEAAHESAEQSKLVDAIAPPPTSKSTALAHYTL
ncbi:MAG TPA: hypothetical protein VN578_24160 [Candidatus Binatia bacterium]|jgi:hypothetical protein|nr:hypothetical protein [Candidatus Binatia bacterium]